MDYAKCIYIPWNIIQPFTRKEILTQATTWIKLEGVVLSEESQTEKDKYSMVCGILYGMLEYKNLNSFKQRVEWCLPRVGLGGIEEWLFNGYRVLILQDEKWVHNAMNVLNSTELYPKKWLRWHLLCYMYFTTIKIKKNFKC